MNEGSRWARASPTTSRAADATSLPRDATEAANLITWDARRDAAATTPVARCDRRSAQASEPASTRSATKPSSNAATAAQGASGSGANVKATSVGACVELKFYGAFDLHAIDATSA